MVKTIILIGFMGAGKSFLGKQAAERLGLPFRDLDRLIEEKTSHSVGDIFIEFGEEHFRQLETQLLSQIESDIVLATGGGIIEKENNRKFLKEPDKFVVWLRPSWEKIISRIKDTGRPLVSALTIEELKILYRKRENLYQECADIVIDDPDLEKLIRIIRNKKTA